MVHVVEATVVLGTGGGAQVEVGPEPEGVLGLGSHIGGLETLGALTSPAEELVLYLAGPLAGRGTVRHQLLQTPGFIHASLISLQPFMQ